MMKVASLLMLACACGARPDLSTSHVVWSVSPEQITITQGGAPIAISIHVENAFDEEVSVDIPSLPLELSSTPSAIPAGAHDATISIRASREAEQGDAGPVSLRMRTGQVEQEFPLHVFVRGCAGCLDTSYAANGVAMLPHVATLATLDASDRALVVTWPATVSRFAADGGLDPSFSPTDLPGFWQAIVSDGGNGAYVARSQTVAHVKESGEVELWSTGLDATYQYDGAAIARTGDGLVLVTGTSSAVVVTMLSSGAIDASFGDGGVVRIADSCGAVTNDGSMFLATCSAALRRLDEHGALVATVPYGGISASKTTVMPDGRYLVAGRTKKGAAIAMYSRDGALDPTFGNGGIAAADVDDEWSPSAALDVLIAPDGKLLVHGMVGPFECCDVSFYLRRLDANGATDATFATNGTLGDFSFDAVALQTDGRIVVAGGTELGFLARYWN
jgi:uncharacterized delta-60 repeat protein